MSKYNFKKNYYASIQKESEIKQPSDITANIKTEKKEEHSSKRKREEEFYNHPQKKVKPENEREQPDTSFTAITLNNRKIHTDSSPKNKTDYTSLQKKVIFKNYLNKVISQKCEQLQIEGFIDLIKKLDLDFINDNLKKEIITSIETAKTAEDKAIEGMNSNDHVKQFGYTILATNQWKTSGERLKKIALSFALYELEEVFTEEKFNILLPLVREFDINICNFFGNTLLILAAKNNYTSGVERLLQDGANPNLITKNNKTAFIYAISNKNLPMTRKLIDYGVNPWQEREDLLPSISYAAKIGADEIIQFLVNECQVNINFTTEKFPITPLSYAKENKRHTTTLLIERLGAKKEENKYYTPSVG